MADDSKPADSLWTPVPDAGKGPWRMSYLLGHASSAKRFKQYDPDTDGVIIDLCLGKPNGKAD